MRPHSIGAALLFGCTALAAPLQQPNAAPRKPAQEATPWRPALVDLARSYLAFEEALRVHGYGKLGRGQANLEFDQLTMGFFLGDYASAVERLDRLVARIDPLREKPAERAADALVLVCDRRWRAKGAERAPIRIVRNHDGVELPEDWDAPVQVQAVPVDGTRGWTCAASWRDTAGGKLLDVADAALPDGVDVDVRLLVGDAAPRTLFRLDWLEAPPAQLQQRLLQRLARLEPDGPPLEQAKASVEARAKRLRDTIERSAPASILLSPAKEWRELQADAALLEAGDDPFRRRVGDHWRVLRTERRVVPLRVYAPPQAAGDEKLPLVVALHGAGGDENHWFEAYGAGALERLAERDGVVVAAPAVGFGGWSGADHDALVKALVYCYALDLSRVHVVGHSMGAAAAAGLAAERPAKLAAVACIAGGPRGAPPAGCPRLLVLSGKRDSVVPFDGVKRAAEAWRAAGAPVEFRASDDEGHTLLVAEHLGEVWSWMLSPRR